MNDFSQFVSRHWILWLLFILILFAIIILELRNKAQGSKKLTPQSLTHLVNRESAVVLDIRPSELFAKGHITGSINIPLKQLEKKIIKLKKYESKPIVCVCAMGQTAVSAAEKLQKQGFGHVYILTGGINAWKAAGFPLIKE